MATHPSAKYPYSPGQVWKAVAIRTNGSGRKFAYDSTPQRAKQCLVDQFKADRIDMNDWHFPEPVKAFGENQYNETY
jgi:hypothetical protein